MTDGELVCDYRDAREGTVRVDREYLEALERRAFRPSGVSRSQFRDDSDTLERYGPVVVGD